MPHKDPASHRSSGCLLLLLFCGYNNQNKRLAADVTGAEDQAAIDIVSNGIKIRTNNNSLNNHSGNMIYWAFASAPIVGTNNIPAVAR